MSYKYLIERLKDPYPGSFCHRGAVCNRQDRSREDPMGCRDTFARIHRCLRRMTLQSPVQNVTGVLQPVGLVHHNNNDSKANKKDVCSPASVHTHTHKKQQSSLRTCRSSNSSYHFFFLHHSLALTIFFSPSFSPMFPFRCSMSFFFTQPPSQVSNDQHAEPGCRKKKKVYLRMQDFLSLARMYLGAQEHLGPLGVSEHLC